MVEVLGVGPAEQLNMLAACMKTFNNHLLVKAFFFSDLKLG
jgi:hypothetical protein